MRLWLIIIVCPILLSSCGSNESCYQELNNNRLNENTGNRNCAREFNEALTNGHTEHPNGGEPSSPSQSMQSEEVTADIDKKLEVTAGEEVTASCPSGTLEVAQHWECQIATATKSARTFIVRLESPGVLNIRFPGEGE
jgi:hypothetical protein